MKKITSVFLAFLLCFSTFNVFAIGNDSFIKFDYIMASSVDNEESESVILNELVVTTTYESAISQQLQTLTTQTENATGNVSFQGCNVDSAECLYTVAGNSSALNSIETFLIKTETNEEASALYTSLDNDPSVVCVEYNYYLDLCYEYDPEGADQWALDKIGVGDAWDMGFVGNNSIEVAVIDTGANLYDELLGNLDCDKAWNFHAQSSNVNDPFGHGTIVSGIIGAATNGVEMSGVCKNVSIVPLKIDAEPGQLKYSYLVDAIEYCIDNDIEIINLSMTLHRDSHSVITLLANYDGIVVAAAGNNGENMALDIDNAGKNNYLSNFVVVGSSTSDDEIADHSNFSGTFVDVFAPGEDVYSLRDNETGFFYDGTSVAAPHFTAAAALIWAEATHYSNIDVIELLLDNVTPVATMTGKCTSGGILNITAAINTLYEEMRPAYSKGDLNGDGYVTDVDKTVCRNITRGTVNPSEQQLTAGDLDGDGVISMSDYIVLGKYISRTMYFAPY